MFYDYVCDNCGEIKEEMHGINETPEILCDNCKIVMKKIVTGGSGFILKGNGWGGKNSGSSNKMARRVTQTSKAQQITGD